MKRGLKIEKPAQVSLGKTSKSPSRRSKHKVRDSEIHEQQNIKILRSNVKKYEGTIEELKKKT